MANAPSRLAVLLDVAAALELEPHELQSFDPDHPRFDASRPLLVLRPQFEAARAVIEARYPESHPARAVVDGRTIEATRSDLPPEADAWLLAPMAPGEDLASLEGLRGVMERLYGPDGCPWDREQTHESLRKYLLEEAYELVDAIDRADVDDLREELGDLLAHIFMQTSIAQELHEFTAEDVVASAASKMVRRHPHVFGDEAAGSTDRLLERWDEIKAEERAASESTTEGVLASVPRAAPSLQRAQSLQQRAVRAGAIEPDLGPLHSVARAVGALGPFPDAEHLGRLLWETVRLARSLEVDAEEALRAAAAGFEAAFGSLEASTSPGAGVAAADEADRAALWPDTPSRPASAP